MLLRIAMGVLVAVALQVGNPVAATSLPSEPTALALPAAPAVISFPKPSELRPGSFVRRSDGAIAYVAAVIRIEELLPLPATAANPVSLPFGHSSALASRGAIELLVRDLAPQYGLDPNLVLAVVAAESSFRVNALSPAGAAGLMQLMPATARRFGVRDIYDPIQNLQGGMSYLGLLLSYFRGNVEFALAAYNAGEGAVDRYLGVPPFAETKGYISKIMRAYRQATHPFDPGLIKASRVAVPPRTGS